MNIIIVDKNDNQIGVKERDAIDRDNDIYRVSCLWLFNHHGNILLAQRAFSKRHDPGMWGPAVAGTIEEGETYEGNIVKETEEEIGVTGLAMTKGDKVFRDGNRRHFTQRFFAVTDLDITDFRPDPREVHSIRWWEREEFENALREHPEEFLPSLKKEGALDSVWRWFEQKQEGGRSYELEV